MSRELLERCYDIVGADHAVFEKSARSPPR